MEQEIRREMALFLLFYKDFKNKEQTMKIQL